MGMQNRNRDFTTETMAELNRLLQGSTEPSQEFTDFWKTYGEYFDFDGWADCRAIDDTVSELRWWMSDEAPAQLAQMQEKVYAADEAYAAECRKAADAFADYGTAVQTLANAISKPGFSTDFDAAALTAQLMKNPNFSIAQRLAFMDAMAKLGVDSKTARILWGLRATLGEDYAKALEKVTADIQAGEVKAAAIAIPIGYFIILLILALLGSKVAYDGIKQITDAILDAIAKANTDGSAVDIGEEAQEGSQGKVTPKAIPQTQLEDLPENAQESYKKYAKNGWQGNVSGQTEGTVAGKTYRNDDNPQLLPDTDAEGNKITYKEFDVNNKQPGQGRDGERFYRGSNGKVYYSPDHGVEVVVEILE